MAIDPKGRALMISESLSRSPLEILIVDFF